MSKITTNYKIITGLFLLLSFQSLHAQFQLNGSAIQISDSCFQLTSAQNWQSGTIWNETKIDLNESFEVIMDLFLGCQDANGADGIVFGFQPISTSQGSQGEGIGFQNISPSIGIEFDTWQNGNLNDPVADHIAIIRNGDVNHGTANTIAGPIQASMTSANIEDCNYHEMRVNWNAENFTLEVYFDCELRLSYTGDIVNEIFGGDPLVFWGFTSATGGANNRHEVCFTYTTFLDGFEDVVICPGGQFQLGVSGGNSYTWTPATGLSNPNIPNPIANPDETTTYVVEVLDDCNNPFNDTITVFVDGDTVFFELGVDTTLCEGIQQTLDATSFGQFSVEYEWSNGAGTPTIDVSSPGLYAVTVTIDDYCVADDRVEIDYIYLPTVNLGLDTSLCLEQSLYIDVTSPDATGYLWDDGSTAAFREIISAGTYTVTLSNICGDVKDGLSVEFEDCTQIFAPNIFSPNDDGFNDVFFLIDEGDVMEVVDFKIFNRWGGLVYEASNFKPNDRSFGWDGKFKGEDASLGVYTWFAQLIFRNGDQALMRGDVTLLR